MVLAVVEGKAWTETVMYVGMASISIQDRWSCHHKTKTIEKFVQLGVKVVIATYCFPGKGIDPKLLRMWERELIERLNPMFNGTQGI